MVLPTEAEVRALAGIADAVRLLRVPNTLWDAFKEQVGNPGDDLRILAALPAHVVVHGIGQATMAGVHLSAVEAAHVGLLWRVSKMKMHLARGGSMDLFVDVDPWEPAMIAPAQSQVPGTSSKGTGLKEKVLKMANLLDQSDASELMPPDVNTVHAWSQRYVQLMGGHPMEEEEPTDAQLAALDKRVNQIGCRLVDER